MSSRTMFQKLCDKIVVGNTTTTRCKSEKKVTKIGKPKSSQNKTKQNKTKQNDQKQNKPKAIKSSTTKPKSTSKPKAIKSSPTKPSKIEEPSSTVARRNRGSVKIEEVKPTKPVSGLIKGREALKDKQTLPKGKTPISLAQGKITRKDIRFEQFVLVDKDRDIYTYKGIAIERRRLGGKTVFRITVDKNRNKFNIGNRSYIRGLINKNPNKYVKY